MNHEKDFILIEEYLDGTLEGEALRDFELRLKSDKELAEEVAIYREVNERFAAMPEKKNLQNQWKKVIEEAAEKENSAKVVSMSKGRNLQFYLVRIAAVLVLGFGFYFLIPKSASPNQLAMNYWEETTQFQFTGVDRGNELPVDFYEDLKSAYEAFDQKKYSKTLEILNELSPETNEVILLKTYP